MRALYYAAILALLTADPSGAQSFKDQVILLTTEQALVGAKSVAAKDVTAYLVGRAKPNAMIEINNCPGVSADAIQALVAGIQEKAFIPVLDFHAPDAKLCELAK
jgi:hypothetical protein